VHKGLNAQQAALADELEEAAFLLRLLTERRRAISCSSHCNR
jgi:hypothetical protein